MSCENHTRMGAGRTPTNTPDNRATELLTTAQVSEITGITVFSLEQYRALRYKGICRGPKFKKLGRAVRYERKAVEAFLSSRKLTDD